MVLRCLHFARAKALLPSVPAFLSWIIEVTAKKDLQVSIEILPFLTGTNFIQHCIMTTPSCT